MNSFNNPAPVTPNKKERLLKVLELISIPTSYGCDAVVQELRSIDPGDSFLIRQSSTFKALTLAAHVVFTKQDKIYPGREGRFRTTSMSVYEFCGPRALKRDSAS